MLVNYIGAMPTQVLQNGQRGMQSAEKQVAVASNEIARQPLYQQQQKLTRAEAERAESADVQTRARPEPGQPDTEQTGLQLSQQRSSVIRELTDLTEGEAVFKANARSIEAAQSMFDNLLAIGFDADKKSMTGHSDPTQRGITL